MIWDSNALEIKWLIRDSNDLVVIWFEIQVICLSIDLEFKWFEIQIIWFEMQIIWILIDLKYKQFGCQMLWDVKNEILKLKNEAFLQDFL